MANITGYWSQGEIIYTHMEEEGIAFFPNGTGLLIWFNPYVEIIDTFHWRHQNERVSLLGKKQITFRDDDLSEIKPSDLSVADILMNMVKRKSINSGTVKALEFLEPIGYSSESRFGFICRDIWGMDHYKRKQEVIMKYGELQKSKN